MPYSPPKRVTIMLSLLILIIGIVLGICGNLGYLGSYSNICVYVGFGLCFLSWLLMWIGVKFRGV
jgi:hypothetical protein